MNWTSSCSRYSKESYARYVALFGQQPRLRPLKHYLSDHLLPVPRRGWYDNGFAQKCKDFENNKPLGNARVAGGRQRSCWGHGGRPRECPRLEAWGADDHLRALRLRHHGSVQTEVRHAEKSNRDWSLRRRWREFVWPLFHLWHARFSQFVHYNFSTSLKKLNTARSVGHDFLVFFSLWKASTSIELHF